MKTGKRRGGTEAGSRTGAHAAERASANRPTSFPVVGIGASAGGMETFVELLRHVAPDTGMAFVLLQHLDATHASNLSEVIARSTSFTVHEIQDGMLVQPDHVYVLPSNAEIRIAEGVLFLSPRPTQGRELHLPIDFFFKSLAAERGNQAIGVVLSGTGADGSEGLRAIKAEDGITFAQEPRSAKFSGMPEAAIKTGAVDFALPIPELARELSRIGRHPFLRGGMPMSPAEDGEFRKVLLLLRRATGVDFSEYKAPNVRRRLDRRMALRRMTTLEEYVPLLREDAAEAKALFADILIHVTSFFRDEKVFETLKQSVFPEILAQKRQGGAIRIWSAGCSTGEEAYTLLILLLEFLAGENARDIPVQLFGSDISEQAIEKARAGFYPESSVRDMHPERLARFFTKVDGGGYRINRSIRERCAFGKHDLASDPPFSKLDLVSCRNVLIYFGQELQQRVLASFQFALKQPGFLLLGSAENIADGSSLFSVIDKEHRLFARTATRSALRLAPARTLLPLAPPESNPRASALSSSELIRRTESRLLDQYAPPGVIVNERMEILHFRGRTGPYLEPTPGQPQHHLLKMARKGLLAELRIAISQAKKQKTTVRRSGVRVEQDGSTRLCDVVVIPLASTPESHELILAVLFEEPRLPEPQADQQNQHGPGPPLGSEVRADERRVASLEDELTETNDYLQSVIDEHQRTNEELVTAGEELVSSNEELRSLNEELESAKEELQSTNEELSTLNEELQTRNGELDCVNSDLVNILRSVEVPIVIVDAHRRIRRFTPKARPILNLLPSDVGRPIDDIKPTLAVEQLDQKIADVIDTMTMHEEDTRTRDGRWFRLQIRPYTTVDNRIDGAVLSIIDIDALKRALGAAERARDYAEATVEAVQTPLLVLGEKLNVMSVNEAFHERYGLSQTAGAGRIVFDVMEGTWNIPELRSALERVLLDNERFQRLEVECDVPRLGARSVSLSGRAVATASGERTVLLAVEDITERLRAEAERARLFDDAKAAKASAEEANRMKDLFLATLSHELRTPLSTLLLQAQLLRRGKTDEARLRKASELIERAVNAQAQLIDDLLDTSRIVAGKLKVELSAVALAPIVEAAVEAVSMSAEKRRLALDVRLDHGLPPVLGDSLRLQQVVLNLLTNAIKFTPEHGNVTVTVDAADGWGRIRVMDTGAGIAPDFLHSIFDRFSQEAGSQIRSNGGLGLGLAIVRHLIDAHGGTVQAQSAGKGSGSTFTVLLPLIKEMVQPTRDSEAELPVAELAAGSIRDTRVLIVEDDPATRSALSEMLGMSGAAVCATDSIARALEVFEAFKPELVISDIAMPDEDGYTFLRRIRALGPSRGGDVPALALTALAGEEDRDRAFAAGFQVHMAKPVDIDRLLAALSGLLTRTSLPFSEGARIAYLPRAVTGAP